MVDLQPVRYSRHRHYFCTKGNHHCLGQLSLSGPHQGDIITSQLSHFSTVLSLIDCAKEHGKLG